MNLVKMSLTAALLLGANAYAIDNVKVNGDVQVFYGTQDESLKNDSTNDIFDKDASYVDTALHLGLTADLSENVSSGVSVTMVSTLGLENNLGSLTSTWSGAHSSTAGSTQVDDAMWISEAWLAGKAGETTLKLGRQSLDTPLIFTETWSLSTNTFEATVLLNQDLPDTTLIGAWVGKSNGIGDDTSLTSSNGSITGTDGKFNTFANSGAYVMGALNNSWKPLSAQAWYYDLRGLANAYWLQVDLDMEGILFGAQYTNINSNASGAEDDVAYSVMLGYEVKDTVTITAAFSSVDDEGTLGVANVATRGSNAGSGSKLYTEMWWWYGTVSATGAQTISLSAEATVGDGYDLYLGLWTCDIEPQGATSTSVDEIAVTVSKSYGPLDTSIALIHDEFDQGGGLSNGDAESLTTLQLYLTYNF